MRPSPMHFRFLTVAGTIPLAAALAMLLSCAKMPLVGGTPMLSIKISSTPDANSCGRGTGNSLYFRILQVSDANTVTGLALAQLWDKEDKVLGPALLAKNEEVIDAGSSRELKLERNAAAKAVVVVGNFCNTEGTCWRIIHPASAGSKLTLMVDASCLRQTKR